MILAFQLGPLQGSIILINPAPTMGHIFAPPVETTLPNFAITSTSMSSVSSVPTEDATQAPVAKQPLHPSIIDLLDPEYIEFHNKHVVNITPPHTLPWSPAIRNGMAVPGGTPLLKVAKTQDFDLPTTKCRAFTPEGTPPAGGWPLFIFFHGGARVSIRCVAEIHCT